MDSALGGLVLREEAYDSPAAQALVTAVQLEYVARYGGPDEGPVDPREFDPPGGRFLVGYVGSEAIATGGFRRVDAHTVEVKRMYVVPAYRRRGLSRQMLARLEEVARDTGATRVLLETGHAQPEAIALYRSSGYEQIEGFGHYSCHPNSFSFGKDL